MAGVKGRKHSDETKEKIRLSKIGKPRSEELKRKLSIRLKGKTYEDLYGEEKAKKIKQKARDFINNRPDLKYQTKGKTYEEIMGEEKALIRINKLKRLKKELNPFYQKKHTKDTRNKIKDSWTEERKQAAKIDMLNGKAKYVHSFKDMDAHKIKMSEMCKNGHAAWMNKFIQNPSKPQKKLYEMVLFLCPYAVLNYPCLNYSIDIAIPFLNLAIEYDEPYWHQNKKADKKRQKDLEQEGWKFIRFDKLPDINLLKEKMYFYTECR
jgi:very-short-patch-repair endonuclease